MKPCTKCGVAKAPSEFYADRTKRSGRQSWCKECIRPKGSEYTRARRLRDPEWADRSNRVVRLRRYGLTIEQYDAMLEAQGGVCAICRQTQPHGVRLCVDHDHSCCAGTKRCCGSCVRGLLCSKCNTHVGVVELHGSAIAEYLSGVAA